MPFAYLRKCGFLDLTDCPSAAAIPFSRFQQSISCPPVYDGDRVALNSMHFSSLNSAGASCKDSDWETSDLDDRESGATASLDLMDQVQSRAESSSDDSVSFCDSV